MIGDHLDSVVLKLIIDQSQVDREATKAANTFSNAFQNKIAKPGGGFYSKAELDKAYIRASKTIDSIAAKQNAVDEKQRNVRKNADIAAEARADAASARAQRRHESTANAKIKADKRASDAEYRELVSRGRLEAQITRDNARERRRQNKEDIADAQRFFRLQNAPTPKGPKGPKAPNTPNTDISLSKAGRVGAGIATMTGNYQMAGGMYAAANIMDATGLAVSRTTALVGGLSLAVPVALGSLALYGRELNKELANMSTLLLPATAGVGELRTEIDKVSESAQRLAVKFNVNIVDVVKSFKEALSSGIDSKDLERFGNTAGVLSSALGEDFGKSVSILTSFKDTYNLSISELTKTTDTLFNIVDQGKVNSSQLLTNMGRLLPVAKNAGIGITDLAGAFATLTRQMTVAQATTSLGRAIEDILAPSAKARKAFNELGITYGSAAFQGRTLVDVMQEIKDKAQGSGEKLAALFPERQGLRAVAALTTTLDLLKKISSVMGTENTGITASLRQQDTLWFEIGSKIEGITSSLKQAGSELGNLIKKGGEGLGVFDSLEEKLKLQAGYKGQKPLFQKLYEAGGDPSQLDAFDLEALGIIKTPRGPLSPNGGYRMSADRQKQYQDYIAQKKKEEAEALAPKIYNPRIGGGLEGTDWSKGAKQTPYTRAEERKFQAKLSQAGEYSQKDSYTDLLVDFGDYVTNAQAERDIAIEYLKARIEMMADENNLKVKKYEELVAAGASPEQLAAIGVKSTSEMDASVTRLNKLIDVQVSATDDDIQIQKDKIDAFRESVLLQRDWNDIQKEENEEKKAAKKGESLDNMLDQRAMDLEIQAKREQIAQLKSGKGSASWGIDPLTGKRTRVTTSNSTKNAGRIAQLQKEIKDLEQQKFDRRYEHASFDGTGTPYGSGSSNTSIDSRAGRISSLVEQRNALSATNSQYENWRHGGTDLYGRTKWVQDRPGVTDLYGNTKYQMPKEWEDNKSQIDTIDAEIKQLQSYREEYTSTLTKAADTTKTAFESMADASMLMAESVSSAWSFASGIYAAYRQAVNNNIVNNTNTTVPITVNTPSQSVDLSAASRAINNILEQQKKNGTIKTSYPRTTSPLPTVQSTGSMTSRNGTVSF